MVVLLFSASFGFTQGNGLIDVPLPNLNRGLQAYQNRNFQNINQNGGQTSHYWEVNDQIRAPFETYKYLPVGTMAIDNGFSPATLEWSLSGKHKFVPALDLTVIKLKPGEPVVPQPATQFGTVQTERGHLLNRAKQSIMGFLH